ANELSALKSLRFPTEKAENNIIEKLTSLNTLYSIDLKTIVDAHEGQDIGKLFEKNKNHGAE
ncbi:MAG: hypothetical protein HRT69_17625, partial [Flavobacteriaceae bacterium]|nr:hypothetical protein [Flavobacteriaceae bacterium]